MSDTKFIRPGKVGARYLRPREYEDAFAIALEPKEIMPTGTDGRNEILCTAIVFDDEDALDAGTPSEIIREAVINVSHIYRQLVRTLGHGGVLAGYIGQGEETSYGTKPWVIKDLDPEDQQRVEEAWASLLVAA